MEFMITRCMAAALLLVACGATSRAAWAQCAQGAEYEQLEAVKRRYPDPAVRFDTPAFAPGAVAFTTYEQMLSYVRGLSERSTNLFVSTAGYSQEGRMLPLLLFTNTGRFAPPELRRLGRPVVLIVAQAHGNEPAGGEALLAIAQSLAEGELKPLLDRISVAIMPRVNPDGAHYFWRGTASCVDVNRDHLKVDLPETVAIRHATLELQPEVFVDAHEFSVATRWIEKFNAVQAYDFTMAYATHPNVDSRLTDMAERVFSRNIGRDVASAGYSHFWYYTTAYNVKDKRVAGGGTAPEIGRNYAGLQNALSFLVESRGVGIARDSFARRVHSHYVVMASILRTTAENAGEIRKVTQAARDDIVRRGRNPSADDRVAVTLRMPTRMQKLTMRDPQTGEPKEVEVEWVDPREAAPALTRSRPYAYIVLPSYPEVARRLAYSGVEVRRLRRPVELEVESYEVTERRQGNVFIEGHIRSTVTTEVRLRKRMFPAGSFVYTMAQPNANLLVAALEPESPSGFVALGMVPTDRRGLANPQEAAPSEVPIYRLLRPVTLDTQLEMPLPASGPR
jgi:hypothetical protein